ncbi:MAG TPA: hypothetical protein PLV06_12920 [Bacteroidales bacterium]|nr:hypothetical protein [Bacteroidales bacterium]HPF02907.1 hypothetical protein [Bacteroidales bacterium]HPJ60089.1 hypothetical protein [Bacteroidales bacterium]HPR13283.1 hypothetical protein [Bacteroidales bacterium]HRW85560.1 hypothetical protein [Bacteroidales bacterium]
MNKKVLLIIEVVWIATGILSVAAGIRYALTTGGSRTFIFAALALVSFLFAWIRHRQRIKI